MGTFADLLRRFGVHIGPVPEALRGKVGCFSHRTGASTDREKAPAAFEAIADTYSHQLQISGYNLYHVGKKWVIFLTNRIIYAKLPSAE